MNAPREILQALDDEGVTRNVRWVDSAGTWAGDRADDDDLRIAAGYDADGNIRVTGHNGISFDPEFDYVLGAKE